MLDKFRRLQKTLFYARNYYLNGPSDDGFCSIDFDWKSQERYFYDQLKNTFMEPVGGGLKNLNRLNGRESFSELIVKSEKLLQHLFYENFQSFELVEESVQLGECFAKDEFSRKPLAELKMQLRSLKKEFGISFLFQGSYGDGSAIYGVSDVDLIGILPKTLCGDIWALKCLRRKVYSLLWKKLLLLDPFQHHGVYFFSQTDLSFWNEDLLPLACLRKSSGVTREEIKINCRKYFSSWTVEECLSHFETFFSKYNRSKSLFLNKYVNQVFLLFPAILEASLGRPNYKPDSIFWLYRLTKDLDLKLTEKALKTAEATRLGYGSQIQNLDSLGRSLGVWNPFQSTENNYKKLRLKFAQKESDGVFDFTVYHQALEEIIVNKVDILNS